jgi:hypothetical protein
MLDAILGTGLTIATGGGAGIIGALLGIGGRLVPEVVKYFQDKRDKAHEIDLLRLQIDSADKLTHLRMEESRQAEEYKLDGKGLDTLLEAVKGQFANATGIAATLSACVRPIVTYWYMLLYSVVKIAIVWSNYDFGTPAAIAVAQAWTNDDIALFSAIMNFWFLDRVLAKRAVGRA